MTIYIGCILPFSTRTRTLHHRRHYHRHHHRSSYSTSASSSSSSSAPSREGGSSNESKPPIKRRHFHDYFVTHLPSSSLHPDSRGPVTSFHKLPRSASIPHHHTAGHGAHPPIAASSATTPSTTTTSATLQSLVGRETTVVRIPLHSAKHHFGVSTSRGSRPTNEDAYQAGVIDIPAFAKRAPRSFTLRRSAGGILSSAAAAASASSSAPLESRGADSASGDPQVFYFAVFDGHGGAECSDFLKESLHEYIQDTAAEFELQSTLREDQNQNKQLHQQLHQQLQQQQRPAESSGDDASSKTEDDDVEPTHSSLPVVQKGNRQKIRKLEKQLVDGWRVLVGGYFKRFFPPHFTCYTKHAHGHHGVESIGGGGNGGDSDGVTIEEVMEYAFLRADLDFVSAQASKRDDDAVQAEKPLNEDDVLHNPGQKRQAKIGGSKRFKGGSTCSVAMISTPTPMPFWHPSAPSSLLVSHVGDTRILLCSTATGEAIPLTSNHHPSSPIEANRLRRYAATFVTDSFGEERMSGLANTRAFGDVQSKRIGVSAEPEIRRVEMGPAEYSFLVLMSDGISGTLHDQEVVDIIKEAKTPDEGARSVVSFATEVSKEGDNATCLVIRLGGWERRQEGGVGSMGTKESRDWRRQEATDPRRARR